MLSKWNRILWAFVAICASAAVSEAKEQEKSGAWEIACEADSCIMQQDFTSTAGQTLLRATILRKGDKIHAVIATPLGIDLSGGLEVQVDTGAKEQYGFATCTVEGCFTTVSLSGLRLAAWKAGLIANFTYRDGRGKPVAATLSLMGLSAGLARLR